MANLFSFVFSFVDWLYYVTGFWLFLVSGRFRRATIRLWKSRDGIEHVATAFEIVFSVFSGAVTVVLLLATIRLLLESRVAAV